MIAVAFLPVFTLVGQEGRLFRPLAWSKNFAMAIAAMLAITLDSAIRMLFARMDPFTFRLLHGGAPPHLAGDRISEPEIVDEMGRLMRVPGITTAWTMPIKARLDMLSTGIRTPVGLKVAGADLVEIQKIAQEAENILQKVPGTRSVFAGRVAGGYFLDFVLRREAGPLRPLGRRRQHAGDDGGGRRQPGHDAAIGPMRDVRSSRLLHRPSLPLPRGGRSASYPGRFAWAELLPAGARCNAADESPASRPATPPSQPDLFAEQAESHSNQLK